MQFHNNILCVSGQLIIERPDNPSGVISLPMWKKLIRDGANVVQRGGNGRSALLEFDSLPEKYQELLKKKYGDPREKANSSGFRDRVKTDEKAIEFYSHYKLADGRILPEQYQRQYSANASVLNAIKQILADADKARKKAGAGKIPQFWPKATAAINSVRDELGHTLPKSETKIRAIYKEYIQEGYEALISKKFCNDNTRKVSADLERLMMSLYTMKNKPFGADVYAMIQLFLAGKLEVADQRTGELYKPEDFYYNGKPVEISRATVWNYLNNPDNRSTVDIKRNGQFEFNSMHRPHHHRKPPVFSFSKISMDDRDLPRKLKNGGRVKAYYAYDVASGCVIGRAYSRSKDEELFLDCLRDMFRLIEREDLGMPAEVEVENHLVSKFFDDLAFMFTFVRICNPGNSQEKHAEHFNRAKKYTVEKKRQNGIGRWWAKSEAYRVDGKKINNEFVESEFDYDRLVADDIAASNEYNNQLHPRQKRYPGKTRWQVLLESINPNLAQVSKPVVYKAIGKLQETTIRRNQYLILQYAKYTLPSPDIMKRLKPGNYKVDAYYLPNSDGIIDEVFIYQDGVYLCKCDRIDRYNTAKAEWIEGEDDKAYAEQAKYVAQFDKRKKEAKNDLIVPVIIESEMDISEEPVLVEARPARDESAELDELMNSYNEDDYARKAIEDL